MAVMNRRFQKAFAHYVPARKLLSVFAAAATLALIVGGAGCASSRPSPLVISNPSPASSGEKSAELRVKLVTYNIWGLPSWMTGAPSGRYPRIYRELERLDPDVILLQEAWTAKARKSAPAHSHWSVARASRQHSFFQQSGLMTLSRYPITGGEFYPFSHAAFPDRFVNKGVLKTTLQLADGKLLNVWNVHLQDGGSTAIRLTQVHELVARVQAAEDGQIADVVAGDFNCEPKSPLYRELSEALGPTAKELSCNTPFITWDGLSQKRALGETLDHIFIRRRAPFLSAQANPHVVFSAERKQDRLSDHFGIEAVLSLTTDPRLAGAFGSVFSGPAVVNNVSKDVADTREDSH